jgi:4-hydroxybenzoate polyprenyltransferase
MADDSAPAARQPGRLNDYLAIARLDHSVKHALIVPGIVLAWELRGWHADVPVLSVLLGFCAAIAVASANYVINEWLDRESDRFHPTKRARSAVSRELRGSIVFVEWIVLLAAGFACGWMASPAMCAVLVLFALQGVVYNVRPLRTKDRAYLDVISESVNNPIRLTIGWTMVDPGTLPPGSLLLAFWTGGAFLMAAKRLSEFIEIEQQHGRQRLELYRISFAGYSNISLMVSCFAYALLSSFFLAVFLIKYRIEYLLLAPCVIALFAWYLGLAMRPGSPAQNPERLIREPVLVTLVIVLTALFALLSVVDIPMLDGLASQRYLKV